MYGIPCVGFKSLIETRNLKKKDEEDMIKVIEEETKI